MTAITSYYAKVGLSVDMAQLRKVDKYLQQVEKKILGFHKKSLKLSKTISLGISVDVSQLKKIDKYLQLVEKRVENFQKRLATKNKSFGIDIRFGLNKNLLLTQVQSAFVEVSKRAVFPIEKFIINKNFLSMQIASAVRSAINSIPKNINLAAKVTPNIKNVSGRVSTPSQPRSPSSLSRTNFLHAGGIGGAVARYGFGSLPFVGGAYGVSQLNQANQEAISSRLTTQAVVQAKGYTEQQGQQAFGWLRNLGNEVGFNYMQAAPDYNQFLSNALGAGLGIGGAQDIFKGFSEYQTAVGITPARRKLVQNALSQMLGKGTLSMEELRRQMAESMPGTMDVFAQALAEQTGTGKTGQAALADLYEQVESGNVKSAALLPIVARILSERAQPKLGILKESSIAQQARAENAISDLVNVFSGAGGEKGFANIFKGFTSLLTDSTSLVRSLSSGFQMAASSAAKLLSIGESFARAIEGTDSQVARWLGADQTKQLQEDWANIKLLFDDIINIETPAWLPTLEATAKEIAMIMEQIGRFQQWRSETSSVSQQIQQDAIDRYSRNPYGGRVIGQAVGLAKANWFTFSSMFSGEDTFAEYWNTRNPSASADSPQGWRDQYNAMTKEASLNSIMMGRYNKEFQPGNTVSGNTFNFTISLEGGTEGLQEFINTGLKTEFENTIQFFGRNQ